MPYEIKGLDKTLKALRQLSPDLYKEMNKEITIELKDLRDKARSYIPNEIKGLSSWAAYETKFDDKGKRKSFPQYEPTAARKGIFYRVGRQKPNRNGWAGFYTLFNTSATGGILETAGRRQYRDNKKPYRSDNPNAREHFISAIAGSVGGLYTLGKARGTFGGYSSKQAGRLIFRAVAQDQGNARMHIVKAVEATKNKFNITRRAA